MIDDKIKMKYRLIDLKLIEGVHIDRKQNLPLEDYEVTEKQQAVVFKRK